MIDISCSAYSKLQKINDQTCKKNSEHPNNRLLLLDITDGTTEIKAMEYRPISFLDSNINPGTKVMHFAHFLVIHNLLLFFFRFYFRVE